MYSSLQGGSWRLAVVDPGTGTSTLLASFTPADDDVRLDAEYAAMNDNGPIAQRHLFSADLTRAVAKRTLPDGTGHVGWIDRSGAFTDVTAAEPAGADFASTTTDDSPAFGPDGAFYFAHRPSDGAWKQPPAVWRLEGSDPAAAREAARVDEVNYTVDAPSRITGLCAGCAPFSRPAGQDKGAFRVTGFLGHDAYLSTDSGNHMVYRSPFKAEKDTDLMDWGTDGTKLIPETNRTVWSPIADPSATTVAFLSEADGSSSGTSGLPHELFTVPATGGTPHRVPVTGETLTGPSPALIDWL
ncbi:hypothetical protein [Kitasatospora sp. NBC_01539]|uniref:hypothetical protein n=1 Tax=Kitasatospora sp. NBC_01539 TaxID=2903577 RepID=UPI0038602EDD